MAGIDELFLSGEDVDRVDLGLQEIGGVVEAPGIGTRLPCYRNPRDE